MIEKVAKSLYASFDPDCICNRCTIARREASAAIEAMLLHLKETGKTINDPSILD